MDGVIHVGAHHGEEVPSYIQAGKVPVLGFEPLPDAHAEAQRIHAQEIADGNVQFVNAALGDTTGPVSIFVAKGFSGQWDTPAASVLGPVLPRAAARLGWEGWLQPYNSRLIDVMCWRFEDWVDLALYHQIPFHLDAYSELVIDVQGYELQVLKGFGAYIGHFTDVIVECSEEAVYAGEAEAEVVVSYMVEHGFLQATPTQVHGDVYFARA